MDLTEVENKVEEALKTAYKTSYERNYTFVLGLSGVNSEGVNQFYGMKIIYKNPYLTSFKIMKTVRKEVHEIVRLMSLYDLYSFTIGLKKISNVQEIINDENFIPSSFEMKVVHALLNTDGRGISGRKLYNTVFNVQYELPSNQLPKSNVERLDAVARDLVKKGFCVKTKLGGILWYTPYFIRNMADQGIDWKEMVDV